jgi:endonuclease/exonuclease/phosphatase (EEP) superfamily protein YafD
VEGLAHVAGHSVDHVFVRGLHPTGGGRTLDRGELSDHLPVLVELDLRKDPPA